MIENKDLKDKNEIRLGLYNTTRKRDEISKRKNDKG